MTDYIYLNNKIVPEKEASISVFDRSYLYGEGVFETLRAYNGHVAFADLHYERLTKNCKKLTIDLPLSKHNFEKALIKTLQKNKMKEAYLRVTVSPVGASFGLKRPKNMSTNFSIFCKKFNGRPKPLYEKGARVILITKAPSDHPTMANIKSTNYLNKMIARDEVVRADADEGLFCTPDGMVLEGSATNIFIVYKGEVLTPPLSEGVLPGITRNLVLQVADSAGLTAREVPISMKQLKACEEVFLTGSTTEILPVREIAHVAKKSPAPGPVTKKVIRAYQDLLP